MKKILRALGLVSGRGGKTRRGAVAKIKAKTKRPKAKCDFC